MIKAENIMKKQNTTHHPIRHKKELGQNFIENEKILDDLVALAQITSEDSILEIGAGAGTLTKKMAQRAKEVIAVEIDKGLLPILGLIERENDNVSLINGDILSINLGEVLKQFSGEKIKVVANIPYYITNDIIHLLLQYKNHFSSLYLMVQKEVGEKIIAGPKEKGYGPLAILCQYYTRPSIVKTVPAKDFVPAPKVDSVFLAMEVKEEKDFSSDYLRHEKTFLKVVKAAFVMRRKTLENNLQGYFSFSKEEAKELLAKANIKEKARGEECSVDQLMALAIVIAQQ